MKTSRFTITFQAFVLAAANLTVCSHAQTAASPAPASNAGQSTLQIGTYQVTERDGSSQVWQRVDYETLPSGVSVPHVHTYTELATGMRYQKNGQWVESKEEIVILPDGTAAATQGQHQVYFPADIYQGVIELVTPDGKHLKSRPVGLSYDDRTNTVLIAVLKNSVGELLGSNQVIFPDAFTGVKADLVMTYHRGGFESDVVLREQPPGPDTYGLNSATTRLQLLTEFFNPPMPGQQAGATSKADGLADVTLKFGTTIMGRGKAFVAGDQTLGSNSLPVIRRSPHNSIPVYKSWVHLQGRTFLVEEVPYRRIAPQLQTLPVPANDTTQAGSGNSILYKVSATRLLPSARLVQAGTNTVQLSRADLNLKHGVVLDYVELDSDTNDFTFQADTTFFISSGVNISGTVTFEGGTVIKFPEDGEDGLTIGTVVCDTTAYSPAVFTSENDDSVGETLPGSSGSPAEGGNSYIGGNSVELDHCQFSYAGAALATSQSYSIYNDLRFMQCYFGIVAGNIEVTNMLASGCSWVFDVEDAICENVSFDQCQGICDGTGEFTNCIFSSVVGVDYSYWDPPVYYAFVGSHNGFGNCDSSVYFGDNQFTDNNPFQSGPLGGYYLSPYSPFVDAGNVTADKLGLYHFTTQTNQAIEGNSPVDLGYHYVALDANGNPLDSNGDGIPDYLQDANGNGIADAGETNWGIAILTQPANQTVVQAGNATFSVTASGIAPLSYQWYVGDGTNSDILVGATNTSLILTNVQPCDAHSYFVVVTNVVGSLTSSNAVLTVQVAVPMVAVEGERIMELTANGDVVSWGGNQYGELGDYTHLDGTNPVHVVGLANVTKIASSLNYSLAIDSGGVLWAWGQLDDEDATNVPTQIVGMTNIIAIAAQQSPAGDPAVAVKADGTVWMWGMSGCDTYGFPPVQITGLSNAVSVAAGNCQTFALTTDGTVWTWGNGNEVPAPVSGLSNIVSICAGDYHTLALASNGVVWAWGDDSWGELGDGGIESSTATPVIVIGLTNVIGIAAGTRHSLAVDAQGNLWAWGDDNQGQLGDGGFGSTSLPFQVPGMSNIVFAAAGSDASAALDGNGNLWKWGDSDSDNTDWAWGDEAGLPALAPQYVDFYNGQLPNLTILNGNNQTPHSGLEFPQPLVFQVTDTNGAVLSNAPVSVEVIAGDMELRTVSGGGDYKGLRLTTDTNGEVSLIGYADQDFSNPNCVVRVLAASRERIVEADFNETLVSPPTILITSPGNGSTYLVGTNQPLTITVDAEAAPGASIQEVDYNYQFNGGGNTPLGVSTQSPYSFIWTNSLWWTNAFVGQYTLSAVAVDDAGAQSDPQSVNITIALDSDGIGIPDYWQLQYFGYVGVDPNSSPDGNGQSLLYDYQNGIDPTDYYDGNLPNLEIVSGDNQVGASGSFLQQPLVVQVTDVNTKGLSNAPVVFGTLDGNETFAATTNDTPVSTLTLRTGPDGQVPVWVYFSPASGTDSQKRLISATAWSGNNSVAVTCNEFTRGRLGYWRFNTTEWLGEEGQVPLGAANLSIVPDWSVNAVEIDTSNQAFLAYRDVEANGMANIVTWDGSIRFWFKPDWNSSTINSGTGPGDEGRLIELGSQNSLDGWWALVLSPDGTTLSFNTQTNGVGMTNLTATISWNSNDWHQVVLTYSTTNSSLYLDGWAVVTNGAGVSDYPDAAIRANGFYIGSDNAGNNQARGEFDELETFNYPLSLGEVTNDYNPLVLSPPTVSLIVTDGVCDTTLNQDQASEIISHVTGMGYPNPISFVVADSYADAVFAENAGLVDSESEGINITKLPPPVVTPSSGYFNYPSNIVISLGAEDLTNLVLGLYQTELGRLGGSGELQTVIAYAQGLRSEGQSDEDIRSNLISGPYFRGSIEYADEFGGPGDVYEANTNYTIEYSLDNGVSWNIYNSPIQVTNSVTLQARVEKAGSSDNRTHYAYLDSDAAEAQFEYIPASWLEEYFGTNYQNNTNAAPDADPNNDGLSNLQEYQLGNNPTNVPNQRLGYWRFNTTEWLGEEGQVPLGFTNLASVPDWSGFALGVDTNLPAFLAYRVVENNGNANISCGNGSLRFWFSSDWNGSTTNSGTGPGSLARLIELGSQDSADGWWALVLSPDGTTLNFITQTNGIGTTNLSATVNWASNDWHQVVLTYSATNSALYLDGQVVVNGAGVVYWPDATALTNGFYIGSDNAGNNQARGQFDELETFNYPLSAALISSNYNTVNPNGSGPIDYIGYLEGLNPLAHGATIPDTKGIVNLQIYTPLH